MVIAAKIIIVTIQNVSNQKKEANYPKQTISKAVGFPKKLFDSNPIFMLILSVYNV